MLTEEIRNIKSGKKDLRNFGLVVGGVLVALGLLLLYKDRPASPYVLSAGAVLAVFGLVLPRVLKPVQRAWMSLAVVMGWVMTRVILAVLFYLLITPIGLLSRALGKRYLELDIDRSAESYWHKREGLPPDRKSYEKQF